MEKYLTSQFIINIGPPPQGIGPLKGGEGGGLQGFGVNGKVFNITLHHQYRSPPQGIGPLKGGEGGGGLQGFGVNGKVFNITVHHQYRLLFLRCAYY